MTIIPAFRLSSECHSLDKLEQLFRTLWRRKIFSDPRSSQRLRRFVHLEDFDGVADLQLGSLQLLFVASDHRVEFLEQLFCHRDLRGRGGGDENQEHRHQPGILLLHRAQDGGEDLQCRALCLPSPCHRVERVDGLLNELWWGSAEEIQRRDPWDGIVLFQTSGCSDQDLQHGPLP